MKAFISFILLMAACLASYAQDTVTITYSSNAFTISNGVYQNEYPKGYATLIYYPDTNYVQFNNPNNVGIFGGRRFSYYKNGNTGSAFTSSYELATYYNANMVASSGGSGVESITAGDGITVTGTTTPTVAVTDPIYTAQVSISSAQLQNIQSSPVTLIAAPGAGKVIQPIGAIIFDYTFGTAPYSAFTANIYEVATNRVLYACSLIPTAASSIIEVTQTASALTTQLGDNASLKLGGSANPTGGDGTLKVTVLYKIVTR